jgi:hypothetical protein
MDTDNRGFDVEKNYFSRNSAEAIIYEISYNAVIEHNTFIDNDWGSSSTKSQRSFPGSAVYISESGGDARVQSNDSGEFKIEHNKFINNWGGVVLWENSNRYCGDGSDGACTLVTAAKITISSCTAHLKQAKPSQTPDYYDDCRWKTRTVTVSNNSFEYTPSKIGPSCTSANFCGFNGVFSEYGTTVPWKAWAVPAHISDHQHNVFSHNSYVGPWHFDGFALGEMLTWSQWRSGVANADSSGQSFVGQDKGSTYGKK